MLRNTFIGLALVGVVCLFGAGAFGAELLSTGEMMAIQGGSTCNYGPFYCEADPEGEMCQSPSIFIWYKCTMPPGPGCSEFAQWLECKINPHEEDVCNWYCDAGK